MSADFSTYRGNQLIDFVPISTTHLMKQLVAAAKRLGLNWTPDIIERAGLYIDSQNKQVVLDELNRLEHDAHIADPAHSDAIRKTARAIRVAIIEKMTDGSLTAYIG